MLPIDRTIIVLTCTASMHGGKYILELYAYTTLIHD